MFEFSEWAADLRYASLPAWTLDRARLVLLDDLGAVLGAAGEAELEAYRGRYLGVGGRHEATVLAPGFVMTDRFGAAELNGMAGCWLEVDEGYRLATSHAGIYAIPALLAVAESEGLTARELLEGLVVGYEIAARFAHAWSFPPLAIHPHGAFSPVGAAVAVAKARGYSSSGLLRTIQTASAFAIASPYNHATGGALVRNVWTGAGARLGIMASELAMDGILGLPSSPLDVFGTALQGEWQEGALSNGLGENYAIESGYHKPYACCQYAHATIDALLELRARHEALEWAREVESIVVETHPKGLSLDVARPETTLGAKFSLPHAVAAGLAYGTGGPSAFTRASIEDPGVRALSDAVELRPIEEVKEWPEDRPSRITVRLRDGSEDTAYCATATGDPSRPLSRCQLVEKFVEVAGATVRPQGARGLADQILGMPEDLLVRDLVRLVKEAA
ncbi:MmgE/PrpD family protein [Rubrobacter marinus]|uniref:MmgE/PrpD family protein n=1 Tax=Rubrobacter marinus TaxID=2653852 RepID=UPI001407DBEA|nr:MmgE/PrpD family protein [Rubrobacter marinus]